MIEMRRHSPSDGTRHATPLERPGVLVQGAVLLGGWTASRLTREGREPILRDVSFRVKRTQGLAVPEAAQELRTLVIATAQGFNAQMGAPSRKAAPALERAGPCTSGFDWVTGGTLRRLDDQSVFVASITVAV